MDDLLTYYIAAPTETCNLVFVYLLLTSNSSVHSILLPRLPGWLCLDGLKSTHTDSHALNLWGGSNDGVSRQLPMTWRDPLGLSWQRQPCSHNTTALFHYWATSFIHETFTLQACCMRKRMHVSQYNKCVGVFARLVCWCVCLLHVPGWILYLHAKACSHPDMPAGWIHREVTRERGEQPDLAWLKRFLRILTCSISAICVE